MPVHVLGTASIVDAAGSAARLERKTREVLAFLALRAPAAAGWTS